MSKGDLDMRYCSGMLVKDGFISRFCCDKFLTCLSYISLLLKRIIMET